MKYSLASFLVLFNGLFLFAQSANEDTLRYELPSLEVHAKPILSANDEKLINKETLKLYAGHSTADLLQSEGLAFIKAYGPSGIATPSIRGGAAGQTAIFWNGLPLQSPTHGVTDLSIIGIVGVDKLKLSKGGQSTRLGANALSGAIEMTQQAPKPGFSASLFSSLASFSAYRQAAELQYANKKIGSSTHLYRYTAKNDFEYSIREDLPTKTNTHAELNLKGLQQNLFWNIRPQQQLKLFYQYQKSERQIPPTSVQTSNESTQDDSSHRLSLQYEGVFKNTIVDTKLAYIKENILFQDPRILLVADSYFEHYFAQVNYQQQAQNWLLQGGIQYNYAEAFAKEYGLLKNRHQLSVYQLLARPLFKNAQLEMGSRINITDRLAASTLAFHASLSGKLLKPLSYYAKVSRDFRVPSLNDLYWRPGGDPDLTTEIGFGQELGLKLEQKKWSYQVNLFSRDVDNWIQWVLDPSTANWGANNIVAVWSRGIEQEWKATYKLKAVELQPLLRLEWIKSTHQKALENPSIEKGEQLWYVPEWQMYAAIKAVYQQWTVSYQQQWTGQTVGINDDLDAYTLGRLSVSYQKEIGKSSIQAYANINNLWKVDYRVIENRPMPRQAFELGISLAFAALNDHSKN